MIRNKIQLAKGYRLQFEPAQGNYVLLYPEGMVGLNDTAADIIRLCEEARSHTELLAELNVIYDGQSIENDVEEFIEQAMNYGWLVTA